MKSRLLFTLCLLFTLTAAIYGQKTPENTDASDFMTADEKLAEEKEPPGGRLTPEEKQRTELEIKSSTMPELAVWCRSLGLPESGIKEELAKRIREYFGLQETNNTDDGRKILIIESAQSIEYFTVEVIDEDYARLKGDVRLVLHDKEDIHKIKADEVLLNRTRNIITAKGKVEYIKEKGDTTEIFKGESITVNIDDWDSVFLDGDSEKTLSDENTAYRFEGTVISRSYDDVVILNNARISNAKNEDALWSITASKLWLLPGSDFALFNMVLKVGEIPVLYFPFFYYSADDLIFHPVIGYRSREGGFVQTSTYIMGRPKGDTTEQNSITKILGGSSDMEKEPNGIFLRSTGKKATNTEENSLKLLADYYVNLGAYAGIDFSAPKLGILNSFDFSVGVGFSRTISMIGGNYTPYAPKFDGSVEWNYSNLFSNTVPFRYRMKTQSSIKGTYGGFSWLIPFYSDPFIDRDFYQNRSETMDWFKMIQQGSETIDDDTRTDIGPYSWQINGNISPSVDYLSPYVSSMSISNLSTSLAFKIIRDNDIYNANTDHPGRDFFAPDKYTIYNASGSISGTPLTIGKKSSSAKDAQDTEQKNPLKNIGEIIPPWEEDKKTYEKIINNDKLAPPALNKTFDIPRTGNTRFTAGYQLSPSGSSELQFMSGGWKKSEDINWNEVQSIMSNFSGNGNINFNYNHSEGLFTNSLSFSGGGTWRDFNYLNEEAEAYDTEAERDAARKQQYAFTNYSSTYAYNTTLKPLYRDPIFGQSNIQYSLGGTLVKSKKYTDGDGPELTPQWGTLRKEQTKDGEEILGLRNHKLTTNIAANIMDKQQNLTVSADLPPLDPLIQTNAAFRVWYSTTTARIDFKKPEMLDNKPNDEWKIDPLYLTETLDFGKINIIYSMAMEPEDGFKVNTITASLTLWDFTASFSAVKLNKWKFVYNSARGYWEWVQQINEEPSINPRDLTFSYKKTLPEKEIIKNRLGFSVNVDTRLFYDLQRHTNSNFQFTTGFTLKVNNFLDFTLSATSENAVVFRYFKGFPGMEEYTKMYIDGPQNNVFIDLFDSFNFFDNSKRQRSGFKMKRFNLTAVHHLGDWNATFEIEMSPYLDTLSNPWKYDINSKIKFLVEWVSISEIKTDLRYEKRLEKWTQNK